MSELNSYWQPVATLLLAVAIGLAVDVIVYRLLSVTAKRRHWRTGIALGRALRGMPTLFALLIGARIGVGMLGIPGVVVNGIATGLKVVAVLGATWSVAILLGELVRIYTSREDTPLPSSSIFVNLVRWIVGAVGIVVALDVAGISIGPLIAALGVGGLAIGLALQPTLENLFSGVQVLASRQVQPGDYVCLETGEEGWIEDVTWRITTIKTISNDIVLVPNSTIAKSRITNFTMQDQEHSVVVHVSVAYDSDLAHVEQVTADVAADVVARSPEAADDFTPIVRFAEFADSGINLFVVVRSNTYAERFLLRHEMIKALHLRFAEEGIEIPFPQRVVHMADAAGASEQAV